MRLELVLGDITRQPDVDAVVNAANAELRPGGGVAGAIHRAAGPGLDAECRAHAPIRPGQAVITGAHGLPNRFVIHCLGPRWGIDEPADALLASCYRAALRLGHQHGVRSIAFPAISTGVFGFPMDRAADIAIRTVLEAGKEDPDLELLRFVLHDETALQIHQSALQSARSDPAGRPPFAG